MKNSTSEILVRVKIYIASRRSRGVTAELGEFGARDASRRRVARDDSKEFFVPVPRVNDGAPLGAHPSEDANTVGEFVRADLGASVRVHQLVQKWVEFHDASLARGEGGAHGVEDVRKSTVQTTPLAISHGAGIIERLDDGLSLKHGLNGARGDAFTVRTQI